MNVRVDKLIFFTVFLLSLTGLLFIWSATFSSTQLYSLFFKKQLCGVVCGNVLFYIASLVDYRKVMRWAYLIYPFFLLILLYTLFKGSIGLGGQRWVNIGILKFQPSELGKILLPAYAAYQFSEGEKRTFVSCILIFFLLIISFFLIKKQPDLGTGIIILLIGTFFCWFAGVDTKFFLYFFVGFLCASPLLYNSLKPYQQKRIAVFLDQGDSLKEKYQKDQSLIAIGSGGLFGKGLLQGTQNKLHFLPEGRTDFVFAVLCEEWGLAGALFLLFLYMILFFRLFFFIISMKQYPIKLYAIGMILHIVFSTLVNIMMVLGMLPIVGIPLPFCSYGLTHLLVSYISIGLFNNLIFHQVRHMH